eukprot:SAG11_NODE_28_length_23154_cov_11.023856_3_plen_3694_part_00
MLSLPSVGSQSDSWDGGDHSHGHEHSSCSAQEPWYCHDQAECEAVGNHWDAASAQPCDRDSALPAIPAPPPVAVAIAAADERGVAIADGMTTNASYVTFSFTLNESVAYSPDPFGIGDMYSPGCDFGAYVGAECLFSHVEEGLVYSLECPADLFDSLSIMVNASAFTSELGVGNSASAIYTVISDMVAPHVNLSVVHTNGAAIDSGGRSNAAFTVAFALSEFSSDFGFSDVTFSFSCDASTFTEQTPGLLFTMGCDPPHGTTELLSVAAGKFRDPAGNYNSNSSIFAVTKDVVGPAVNISLADERGLAIVDTLGSGALSNATSITFTLTVTEPVTPGSFDPVEDLWFWPSCGYGVSPALECMVDEVIEDVQWTLQCPVTNFFMQETTTMISIVPNVFTDVAGNGNSPSNFTFISDTSRPSVNISAVDENGAAVVNGSTTRAAVVTITITLSQHSDTFRAENVVSSHCAAGNFTEQIVGLVFNLVCPAVHMATQSVLVPFAVFHDLAGNGNSASETLTYTMDVAGATVEIAAWDSSSGCGPEEWMWEPNPPPPLTLYTQDFNTVGGSGTPLGDVGIGWVGEDSCNWGDPYVGAHIIDSSYVRNGEGCSSEKNAVTRAGTFTIHAADRGDVHFVADWAASMDTGARFIAEIDSVWYGSEEFGCTESFCVSADHGDMDRESVATWVMGQTVSLDSGTWYQSSSGIPGASLAVRAWIDRELWTAGEHTSGLPPGDITRFGMAWRTAANHAYFAMDNFRVTSLDPTQLDNSDVQDGSFDGCGWDGYDAKSTEAMITDGSLTPATSITITFILSEVCSFADQSWISPFTVTNCDAGTFTEQVAGLVYTLECPGINGVVSAAAAAGVLLDVVENPSFAATNFSFTNDLIPPTVNITAVDSNGVVVANGAPTHPDAEITFTFTLSEPAEFRPIDIWSTSCTFGPHIGLECLFEVITDELVFAVTCPVDGGYVVVVNASAFQDPAGNGNVGSVEYTVVADSLGAAVNITATNELGLPLSDGAPTNSATITFTIMLSQYSYFASPDNEDHICELTSLTSEQGATCLQQGGGGGAERETVGWCCSEHGIANHYEWSCAHPGSTCANGQADDDLLPQDTDESHVSFDRAGLLSDVPQHSAAEYFELSNCDNGTLVAQTPGFVYTLVCPSSHNNVVSLTIPSGAFLDVWGNPNSASAEFNVTSDVIAPTVIITMLSDNGTAVSDGEQTNLPYIQWFWTWSEELSGAVTQAAFMASVTGFGECQYSYFPDDDNEDHMCDCHSDPSCCTNHEECENNGHTWHVDLDAGEQYCTESEPDCSSDPSYCTSDEECENNGHTWHIDYDAGEMYCIESESVSCFEDHECGVGEVCNRPDDSESAGVCERSSFGRRSMQGSPGNTSTQRNTSMQGAPLEPHAVLMAQQAGLLYTLACVPSNGATTSVSVAAGAFTDTMSPNGDPVAGNGNFASLTYGLMSDTVQPTVNITARDERGVELRHGGRTNATAVNFTFVLSESMSAYLGSADAFSAVDISSGSCALGSYIFLECAFFTIVPGVQYSGLCPSLGDDEKFSVWINGSTFMDAAGNRNAPSQVFEVTNDFTAPTLNITAIDELGMNLTNGSVTGAAIINFTFSLSESMVTFRGSLDPFTNESITISPSCERKAFWEVVPGLVYTLQCYTGGGIIRAAVNESAFLDPAGNPNEEATPLIVTANPGLVIVNMTAASVGADATASADDRDIEISSGEYSNGPTIVFTFNLTRYAPSVITNGSVVSNFSAEWRSLLLTSNCEEGVFWAVADGEFYTLECPSSDGNTISVVANTSLFVDIFGNGNVATDANISDGGMGEAFIVLSDVTPPMVAINATDKHAYVDTRVQPYDLLPQRPIASGSTVGADFITFSFTLSEPLDWRLMFDALTISRSDLGECSWADVWDGPPDANSDVQDGSFDGDVGGDVGGDSCFEDHECGVGEVCNRPDDSESAGVCERSSFGRRSMQALGDETSEFSDTCEEMAAACSETNWGDWAAPDPIGSHTLAAAHYSSDVGFGTAPLLITCAAVEGTTYTAEIHGAGFVDLAENSNLRSVFTVTSDIVDPTVTITAVHGNEPVPRDDDGGPIPNGGHSNFGNITFFITLSEPCDFADGRGVPNENPFSTTNCYGYNISEPGKFSEPVFDEVQPGRVYRLVCVAQDGLEIAVQVNEGTFRDTAPVWPGNTNPISERFSVLSDVTPPMVVINATDKHAYVDTRVQPYDPLPQRPIASGSTVGADFITFSFTLSEPLDWRLIFDALTISRSDLGECSWADVWDGTFDASDTCEEMAAACSETNWGDWAAPDPIGSHTLAAAHYSSDVGFGTAPLLITCAAVEGTTYTAEIHGAGFVDLAENSNLRSVFTVTSDIVDPTVTITAVHGNEPVPRDDDGGPIPNGGHSNFGNITFFITLSEPCDFADGRGVPNENPFSTTNCYGYNFSDRFTSTAGSYSRLQPVFEEVETGLVYRLVCVAQDGLEITVRVNEGTFRDTASGVVWPGNTNPVSEISLTSDLTPLTVAITAVDERGVAIRNGAFTNATRITFTFEYSEPLGPTSLMWSHSTGLSVTAVSHLNCINPVIDEVELARIYTISCETHGGYYFDAMSIAETPGSVADMAANDITVLPSNQFNVTLTVACPNYADQVDLPNDSTLFVCALSNDSSSCSAESADSCRFTPFQPAASCTGSFDVDGDEVACELVEDLDGCNDDRCEHVAGGAVDIPASCEADANGYTYTAWQNCVCQSGYVYAAPGISSPNISSSYNDRESVVWNNSTLQFDGTCAPIPCPENTVGGSGTDGGIGTDCVCNSQTGYRGSVMWFPGLQANAYQSTCKQPPSWDSSDGALVSITLEENFDTYLADPMGFEESFKANIAGVLAADENYRDIEASDIEIYSIESGSIVITFFVRGGGVEEVEEEEVDVVAGNIQASSAARNDAVANMPAPSQVLQSNEDVLEVTFVEFGFAGLSVVPELPPRLVSAQIDACGCAINVEMDAKVDTYSTYAANGADAAAQPCDIWLEEWESLGEGATCAWTTVKTLKIVFGTQLSYSFSDMLHFKNESIKAAQSTYAQIQFVASLPDPMPPAIAVIDGPTRVGKCDPFTLDASLSEGGGSFGLVYRWSYEALLDNGSYISLEALEALEAMEAANDPANATNGTDNNGLVGLLETAHSRTVARSCDNGNYSTEFACTTEGTWTEIEADGSWGDSIGNCTVAEGGRELSEALCEAPASAWGSIMLLNFGPNEFGSIRGRFTLTVTNMFQASDSVTHDIQVEQVPIPAVDVVGSTQLSSKRSTYVEIIGEAEVVVNDPAEGEDACLTLEERKLSFAWNVTVVSCDTNACLMNRSLPVLAPGSAVDLSAVRTALSFLVVPMARMLPLYTYQVRMTAASVLSPEAQNYDQMLLSIVSDDLIVFITGATRRTIQLGTGLTLDSSQSRDPDMDGCACGLEGDDAEGLLHGCMCSILVYSWECKQMILNVDGEIVGSRVVNETANPGNSPTWIVPDGNALTEGKYFFTVTVSTNESLTGEDPRYGTATVEVEVITTAVAAVKWVQNPPAKVNPAAKFVLESQEDASTREGTRSYKWSVDAPDGSNVTVSGGYTSSEPPPLAALLSFVPAASQRRFLRRCHHHSAVRHEGRDRVYVQAHSARFVRRGQTTSGRHRRTAGLHEYAAQRRNLCCEPIERNGAGYFVHLRCVQ